MTIYHTINWFFAFSFIGYLLECTVLSYENRRPVLNRGFGHGPFCVIYGFGALGACLILEPLAGQPVELYFASVVMATSMELVTAHIMIKRFGAFWWDYSRKPAGGCCSDRPGTPCGLGTLILLRSGFYIHHAVSA